MNQDQPTTCQWIGSNTRLQPTCCQPTVPNRSYCEQHLWLVYQEGTHLRRRSRDIRTADRVRMWEDLFNQAVEELEQEGDL